MAQVEYPLPCRLYIIGIVVAAYMHHIGGRHTASYNHTLIFKALAFKDIRTDPYCLCRLAEHQRLHRQRFDEFPLVGGILDYILRRINQHEKLIGRVTVSHKAGI